MRDFFRPTNSNEQDNLGPETSEGENLDMLAQDDLDGITEASKAMEYESDTSNDQSIDYEEDEDELANGAGPEIDDEEDEAGDASPRSRKRARVNEEGASAEVKGEPSQRTRTKTLPRGEDG